MHTFSTDKAQWTKTRTVQTVIMTPVFTGCCCFSFDLSSDSQKDDFPFWTTKNDCILCLVHALDLTGALPTDLTLVSGGN